MITTGRIRKMVEAHNDEYPSEKIIFPNKLLELMDALPDKGESQRIIDETFRSLQISVKKLRKSFQKKHPVTSKS